MFILIRGHKGVTSIQADNAIEMTCMLDESSHPLANLSHVTLTHNRSRGHWRLSRKEGGRDGKGKKG